MSLGLNNWNNNQQIRERMENEAQEYQLRETDPEQAKKDLASRISVRVVILVLLVAALAVSLLRMM